MAKHLIQIIPSGTALPDGQSFNLLAWGIAGDGLDSPLSSFFGRMKAARQARNMRAMTETMEAAKAYFDARRQAIESCMKAQEQEYRLQSLPQRNGYELEQQGREQWEGLRALEHRSVVGERTRGREVTDAEAALVSAQQALDAQRDLGKELAWKKREVDVLDVDLALAERRAILRQHLEELRRAGRSPGADAATGAAIENALYEARAQLQASGLDTSAIDAVLQQRSRR